MILGASHSRVDRRLPGLGLLLWVLLLYGRHLGDSLLSDDFLYAFWLADGGPAHLLTKVTTDSFPRMIRPLPMLGFLLGALFGPAAQHALSLALHAACAGLVGRLAERRRPGTGGAVALLFATFPLFVEPVVWLSAAFDLWAATFALAALWLGRTARSPVPAVLCFALSLACKESTLLLPVVVFLLDRGRRRCRPTVAALGATATAYLALRWHLFSGPGGYLDGSGRSLAWDLDPWLFLRNAFLQVPFRVLTPFKELDGGLAAAIGLVSLAVLGHLLWQTRPPRRSGPAWCLDAARVGAVFLVALAPTAPVFGVASDHQGSRMLYFPVAVLAIAAVDLLNPRRGFRHAVAATAAWWLLALLWNGASYRDASRHVEGTLAGLAAVQDRLDRADVVWVDGADTVRGAFAFRNGLFAAARLRGLRGDVDWRLGPGPSTAPGRRHAYRAVPDRGGLIWRPQLPPAPASAPKSKR